MREPTEKEILRMHEICAKHDVSALDIMVMLSQIFHIPPTRKVARTFRAIADCIEESVFSEPHPSDNK